MGSATLTGWDTMTGRGYYELRKLSYFRTQTTCFFTNYTHTLEYDATVRVRAISERYDAVLDAPVINT